MADQPCPQWTKTVAEHIAEAAADEVLREAVETIATSPAES